MLDFLGRGVVLLLSLLRSASESEDEMEGRFFLDVVVGECPAIFQLFPGKNQSLLIRRDTWEYDSGQLLEY